MLLDKLRQKAKEQVTENIVDLLNKFIKSFEEENIFSLPENNIEHPNICNCFYCQAKNRLSKAINNYQNCLEKNEQFPPHYQVDSYMRFRELYGYQREVEWWNKKYKSALQKLERKEFADGVS